MNDVRDGFEPKPCGDTDAHDAHNWAARWDAMGPGGGRWFACPGLEMTPSARDDAMHCGRAARHDPHSYTVEAGGTVRRYQCSGMFRDMNVGKKIAISPGARRDHYRTIRAALEAHPTTCRYHGTEWGEINPYLGLPRCETCRAPYRVSRALQALTALESE